MKSTFRLSVIAFLIVCSFLLISCASSKFQYNLSPGKIYKGMFKTDCGETLTLIVGEVVNSGVWKVKEYSQDILLVRVASDGSIQIEALKKGSGFIELESGKHSCHLNIKVVQTDYTLPNR